MSINAGLFNYCEGPVIINYGKIGLFWNSV